MSTRIPPVEVHRIFQIALRLELFLYGEMGQPDLGVRL